MKALAFSLLGAAALGYAGEEVWSLQGSAWTAPAPYLLEGPRPVGRRIQAPDGCETSGISGAGDGLRGRLRAYQFGPVGMGAWHTLVGESQVRILIQNWATW